MICSLEEEETYYMHDHQPSRKRLRWPKQSWLQYKSGRLHFAGTTGIQEKRPEARSNNIRICRCEVRHFCRKVLLVNNHLCSMRLGIVGSAFAEYQLALRDTRPAILVRCIPCANQRPSLFENGYITALWNPKTSASSLRNGDIWPASTYNT